jgi:hypothetical protein
MVSAGMRIPGWSNSESIQAAYRTVSGGSRLGFVMSPAPLAPGQAPVIQPSVAAAGVPLLVPSIASSVSGSSTPSPRNSPPATPLIPPLSSPSRPALPLRLPASLTPHVVAPTSSTVVASGVPLSSSSSMDQLSQLPSVSTSSVVLSSPDLRGPSRRGEFE